MEKNDIPVAYGSIGNRKDIDMVDLIERLLSRRYWGSQLADEAAAEIKRLRELVELERTLREQTVDMRNAEIQRLRGENAAWTDAAQNGHPSPCTLGPLCPYCEVEKLEKQVAQLTVESRRWRALAVGALRAWDGGSLCSMGPVMAQIKEESTR